jgi:hypothetical protein
MFITLNTTDMSYLKTVAANAIIALSKLGFSDNTDTVELLQKILDREEIRVQYWDLGDDILALHLHGPGDTHFIGINEKFRGIADKFCHEFAHVVLGHPPKYLLPERNKDERVRLLYETIMQYARTPEVHLTFELAADIFAAALGFWPINDFVGLFAMCKGDLRLLSDAFTMPVDCVAKWAAVRLSHTMHYFKYNVTNKELEDFYIHPSPDYRAEFFRVFPNGVLADSKSIASECLKVSDDRTGSSTDGHTFCRAIFNQPNKKLLREFAKMYVIGFPKNAYEQILRQGEDGKKLIAKYGHVKFSS